jgi:hypothetical protein
LTDVDRKLTGPWRGSATTAAENSLRLVADPFVSLPQR